MKRLLFFILTMALLVTLVACKPNTPILPGGNDTTDDPDTPVVDPNSSYTVSLPAAGVQTDFVQFTMAGGATFVIQLFPQYAPATVANFKNLVAQGFYNGCTFHRIIEGFMIQGGAPLSEESAAMLESITGEFSTNGFDQNQLAHVRGVISMARSNHPDSATSQFFIVHATYPSLDGKYAAFGRVVAGMDTVDTIAELEVSAQRISGEMSNPVRVPVIESVCFVEYDASGLADPVLIQQPGIETNP